MRAAFPAEFWGEGGIERSHDEAAGWPHLVQLVAETTIDLPNNEGARSVSGELLERALAKSIVRGDTAPSELLRG